MGHRFGEITFTERVRALQAAGGSRAHYARFEGGPPVGEHLGLEEIQFIGERDSFYIASISETGWPYVQHRGGPPGFLRVLEPTTIACADFRGNRQYISVGNLQHDDRVALILVDYRMRRRLKILGHARLLGADDPITASLKPPGVRAVVERGLLIRVAAFDWNCPQHITPRYTAADVQAATQPLLDRIRELEALLAAAQSPG